MSVAGRIVSPFLVPFASDDGWLPSWLWWFQTPDNSLDGDKGWKTEHAQWRFKLSPPLATFVGRVGWLWRNNLYGFSIDVMGAKVKSSDVLVVTGDTATSDNPAHSGSVTRKLYREGELVYFQWYFIYVYGKRCVRVNLGWKLWGVNGTDKNIQYVVYVNPLKTARGAMQ